MSIEIGCDRSTKKIPPKFDEFQYSSKDYIFLFNTSRPPLDGPGYEIMLLIYHHIYIKAGFFLRKNYIIKNMCQMSLDILKEKLLFESSMHLVVSVSFEVK